MSTTSLLKGDPEYLQLRAEIERLRAEEKRLRGALRQIEKEPHHAVMIAGMALAQSHLHGPGAA